MLAAIALRQITPRYTGVGTLIAEGKEVRSAPGNMRSHAAQADEQQHRTDGAHDLDVGEPRRRQLHAGGIGGDDELAHRQLMYAFSRQIIDRPPWKPINSAGRH